MGWSFLGFGLFVCFFLTWKRRKTKEKTKKTGKGRKKKISKNMVFCCFCRFWTAKKIFKIFFVSWSGVFWGLGCLSGFVWHGKAGKQKKKRQKYGFNQLGVVQKKKKIFEARIELATSSVLDWRDNQLHHPNLVTKLWTKQKIKRKKMCAVTVDRTRDL